MKEKILTELRKAGDGYVSGTALCSLLGISRQAVWKNIAALKENGYKTVCAGIRNSVSAFDADLKKSLFLIVGGERRGISAKLLALADQIVRLDYGRTFNGSLSAASAASILGYEILRQNRSKISKD